MPNLKSLLHPTLIIILLLLSLRVGYAQKEAHTSPALEQYMDLFYFPSWIVYSEKISEEALSKISTLSSCYCAYKYAILPIIYSNLYAFYHDINYRVRQRRYDKKNRFYKTKYLREDKKYYQKLLELYFQIQNKSIKEAKKGSIHQRMESVSQDFISLCTNDSLLQKMLLPIDYTMYFENNYYPLEEVLYYTPDSTYLDLINALCPTDSIFQKVINPIGLAPLHGRALNCKSKNSLCESRKTSFGGISMTCWENGNYYLIAYDMGGKCKWIRQLSALKERSKWFALRQVYEHKEANCIVVDFCHESSKFGRVYLDLHGNFKFYIVYTVSGIQHVSCD